MLEGLLWVQENNEAYCVTFAQGLDETELLRRFGGDLSWARLVQFDDWNVIEELQQFGEVVQVGQCDGWAFAYECNGYMGTLPEVLHAISAGTVVVSVFCNVNAHTRFCYVEDGTTIADFDPISPPYEDATPRVLALLRQAGLPEERTEDYDFVGAMFALAEAAGVRLSREAIAEKPLLCSFIRNPFSDFVGDLLTLGGNERTVHRLLAILRDQWQTERLLHILDDRHQTEHLRSVAVRMVRALHSVQITQPLLNVLNEEKRELRAAVSEMLKALIRFDQMHDEEGARERLLALTSATEPEVARHAALTLGTLGDQRAVAPLLHVLSLYPRERAAVQLLGQLRANSATELLLNFLNPQDENSDFQRDLLKALAQIGEAQIVERLMPWLDPESQSSRECSFQQALLASLAQLGSPHIVEALLKLLNPHPESLYTFDFQLRLLEALGSLGERRTIEPLAQLLDHQVHSPYEWYFQEYLAKVLRQLGDTRAELQAVELALQHRAQTRKLTLKATFRPLQQNNDH